MKILKFEVVDVSGDPLAITLYSNKVVQWFGLSRPLSQHESTYQSSKS